MRLAREYPKLALLLFAFFIYNMNCRPIPAGDSVGTAILPFSILYHGTISLDPFVPALDAMYEYPGNFQRLGRDGRYYSSYPVLQPILLAVAYSPLKLIPAVGRMSPETTILLSRVLEKLMASTIAALSVVCFFVLLRRLTDGRRALLLTVVYGFATNTWATSSQALWQHGAAQLAIVASLLCLERFLQGETTWRFAACAGVFAAMAACFRPMDSLFLVMSLLVVCTCRRRLIVSVSYAVPGVVLGSAVAAYNLRVFHHLIGSYDSPFSGNGWIGLAGLTLSPAHGLFVFTPVLLFALAGMVLWLRKPAGSNWRLYAIAALFAVADAAATAKWPNGWGGHSYGPRLLVDALPCMVLLIAPAIDWIASRRVLRAAFAAALVFSVMVQIVGAFCYPMGFQQPEKLWGWSQCPILLNASAGPATVHYRVLATWAGQLAHGQTPDWRHSGFNFR